MAKRKSDDSALLPRKKTKLHAVHDDDNSNTHALHSPSPPPLTLAGFERREKRKRSLDSQPDASEEPKTKQARRSQSPEESSDTDFLHFELHESESREELPSTSLQPDTSEEPKTKQARRSQCPEKSSDEDLIEFEILESESDDDEPTEWERWQDFFLESTREAKEYLSTVRTCRCHNHQTRLLSPGLSDEDTADEGATGSNQLRFPTIIQAQQNTSTIPGLSRKSSPTLPVLSEIATQPMGTWPMKTRPMKARPEALNWDSQPFIQAHQITSKSSDVSRKSSPTLPVLSENATRHLLKGNGGSLSKRIKRKTSRTSHERKLSRHF
ncbi:hypothetical protein THARTR1_07223 [Trichoderma harzianum]|uniref:Uncharacterized protein n=1 Tax=Trichoderma harzianum TaxID=5544 RepID=A0A2K0U2K5_TRIHA|nr:hypothetical protein THARTR1_07223 [Trichoderma harzianum]